MTRKNLNNTRETIVKFLKAYKNKPEGVNNTDWLAWQFEEYPDIWRSKEECRKDAAEIADTVDQFEKNKQELEDHLENGGSVQDYIVSKIEERAKAAVESTVEMCAEKVEEAVFGAGKNIFERIPGPIPREFPWPGDFNPLKTPVGKDMEPGFWGGVGKGIIANNIVRNTAVTGIANAAYQGIRIIGRRIWNGIRGKENKSVEEDLQEFARKAISSPACSGVVVAATGGVTVAVRKGWLGSALKHTPVGHIANAVCFGVENLKTLCKCGTGEMTGEQAVEHVAKTALSFVGGAITYAKGTALGAAIGSVLGPIGTSIGGIAGGIVGGIAGNSVVEAAWNGAKKLASTVGNAVTSVARAAGNAVRSVGDYIRSLLPF